MGKKLSGRFDAYLANIAINEDVGAIEVAVNDAGLTVVEVLEAQQYLA